MKTTSDVPARRLHIRGQVQGVGYRRALQAEARRLGLSGWVRNRRDGSVEALVAGPADALDALLRWAHAGPPAARVTSIDWEAAEVPSLPDFECRETL